MGWRIELTSSGRRLHQCVRGRLLRLARYVDRLWRSCRLICAAYKLYGSNLPIGLILAGGILLGLVSGLLLSINTIRFQKMGLNVLIVVRRRSRSRR